MRPSAKIKAMRERARRMAYLSHAARRANNLQRPAPCAPWQPPELRRILVVVDLDSGKPIIRMMQLLRSRRIDAYRIRTPRGESSRPIGFSRALAVVRKALPRVTAAAG